MDRQNPLLSLSVKETQKRNPLLGNTGGVSSATTPTGLPKLTNFRVQNPNENTLNQSAFQKMGITPRASDLKLSPKVPLQQKLSSLRERNETFTPGPKKPLDAITKLLPPALVRGFKTIEKDIREGLFGDEKDRITLLEMERQGKPAGILPTMSIEGFWSFSGRNQTEQIIRGAQALEKNGIEGERASSLATYYMFANMTTPTSPEQIKQRMQARERFEALDPSSAERNSLRRTYLGNMLGVGLDFSDIIPAGSLVRKGLTTVLKNTDDVAEIARLLRRAGVAEDLVSDYSVAFAKLTDDVEINRGLDSLESLMNETNTSRTIKSFDTAGDVSRGTDETATQARKFKTANEFVDDQIDIIRRGANNTNYEGTTKLSRRTGTTSGEEILGVKRGGTTGSSADDTLRNTTLARVINENPDGFTINLKGKPVTSGYVFSPYKGREVIVDTVDAKSVDSFLRANEDLLTQKGNYLGGWKNKKNNKFYLDVSVMEPNKEKALKGALQNDQIAIYGVKEGVPFETEKELREVLTKAWQKAQADSVPGVREAQAKALENTAIEYPNFPAIVERDTFTLGTGGPVIPATKAQIKAANRAEKAAAKLTNKERVVRENAFANIKSQKGPTENIIERLKNRGLSQDDIENIILEDGTRLVDTVKVKRTKDGTLSTVITKEEIGLLAKSYTDEVPKSQWRRTTRFYEGKEVLVNLAKAIELPDLFFRSKGLQPIFDDIIKAGRDSETMKNMYLQRFKDAGLYKEAEWFQPQQFKLSAKEGKEISLYYLTRQGKGGGTTFKDLSKKAQKFVEIFDGIIADTEPRFFEQAKKLGRTPGKVDNYGPLVLRKDMQLAHRQGTEDFIFRTHPGFFSTKQRAEKVPLEMYEMDYRLVANRWLSGITEFLNMSEATNHIKYLTQSEDFKEFVTKSDQEVIALWLRNITTPESPTSSGGKALNYLSRLVRKGTAVGALGLNYATVLKQSLSLIPVSVVGKARPKLKSKYAKAFGIDVRSLPSISKRAGDIAIQDITSKIGSTFTAPITKFDKANAQLALNGLLDKEYAKFLGDGVEITPEIQRLIEKNAQDAVDMWFGGFFKGQRPEAFRTELGNFILMFLYPLTSQLNGFYRHIAVANGVGATTKASAEVLAAATAIAYMEQVISNLSFEWTDEKQMAEDVLLSLAGNIPVVGNIAYAVINETALNPSPVFSNFNRIVRALHGGEPEKLAWTVGETFGIPSTFRRIREGMQIMEDGGVVDSDGVMLAPVTETIELVRAFLRGKYGPLASKDWVRNIGVSADEQQWFVPQVEFLQNGDYERKAELYNSFSASEQEELYNFLSEGQQKKLDKELSFSGSTNEDEGEEGVPKDSARTLFERMSGGDTPKSSNDSARALYERMNAGGDTTNTTSDSARKLYEALQ